MWHVPSEDLQSFSFVSVPAHSSISIPLLIVLGGREHRPPVMALCRGIISTVNFKEVNLVSPMNLQ